MENNMKLFTMNSLLVLVMNIVRMERKHSFGDAARLIGVPEFLVEQTMVGGIPLEGMMLMRFCKAYGVSEEKILKAAEYVRDNFFVGHGWDESFYWKHDQLSTKLSLFAVRVHYKDYAFLVNRKHVDLPFVDNYALKDGPIEHDMIMFARSFSQ